MNVRLFGSFRLRSPLSHIGEAISTTSYLVQEPILQPDGTIEEVFCYSGNAWRGQLRDLAAAYMLDRLGGLRVPLEAFHLLFSGGRIGGDQSLDIEQARRMRTGIPMLAIFGGGVGNQILPGKMRVSNCYPVCREAIPALPESLIEEAARLSYRGLTFEKSFSRKDDSKDDGLRGYIVLAGLLEGPEGAKADEGPADQMRMTCELLIAGSRLYTEIELIDCSEVELGALTSALHRFSVSPHIGGQANKGHGLAALTYSMRDLNTGEARDFLRIADGAPLLAPPAEAALDAYDQHLRSLYDAMLASNGGEIKQLLGAA